MTDFTMSQFASKDDMLRAVMQENEQLKARLVTEAARTAEQKLRADQMTERLDMANKLGNEAREQLAAVQQGAQPVAWLAEYVDREGNSKWYVSTHKDLAIENDMHGAPKQLYTHPTTQGLDAQIIQALSAGMSIEQWQSSVDVRIGSSDLLGRAIASGEETRIELVRRAVSEVFAAQAKQGGV